MLKAKDIHLEDWSRILFGEVPAVFYVELIIRALVIYLILMFSMRAMGKRMSSQLSRNELAALVSLAAAIGVPLMASDRGLLPAVAIAIVVVSIERIMAYFAIRYQSFEKFSQGNISIFVKDAVIDIQVLKSASISRLALFAQLRGAGIIHLGMVERFYMEANGSFTLIKKKEPVPGLCIIPTADESFINEIKPANKISACHTCGHTVDKQTKSNDKCLLCGDSSWGAAVTGEVY